MPRRGRFRRGQETCAERKRPATLGSFHCEPVQDDRSEVGRRHTRRLAGDDSVASVRVATLADERLASGNPFRLLMEHHEGAENPVRALQIRGQSAGFAKAAVGPLPFLKATKHILFVLGLGSQAQDATTAPPVSRAAPSPLPKRPSEQRLFKI